MVYHMQFLKYLDFLIKTWTIICNLWNISPFSKNVDYHMQFLKFHFLFQKRGLSYAITRISFLSPKMWNIICNFINSFSSPKTWTIICNFWKFFPFSKNVVYHMQFMEF